MKTSKGFTLIEILVVVLIIGILAAIVLPIYNKAVRKSRMAQTEIFIKNASDAINGYIMQNGSASLGGWDTLDIQFPSCAVSTGSDTVANGFLDCGRYTYSLPKDGSGLIIAREVDSKEDYLLGKNFNDNVAFCAAADQNGEDLCALLDYVVDGGSICGNLRPICMTK